MGLFSPLLEHQSAGWRGYCGPTSLAYCLSVLGIFTDKYEARGKMRLKAEIKAASALLFLMLVTPLLLFGQGLDVNESSPGVSGEEIFGFAKVQSEFGPRRPGTEAYEQARDHIMGLMEEWGYKVWTDSIPFEQYFAKHWSLEVVSPDGRQQNSWTFRRNGFDASGTSSSARNSKPWSAGTYF